MDANNNTTKETQQERRKEQLRVYKARHDKKIKDEMAELRRFKQDATLRCRTAVMLLGNHFPPGADETSKTVTMIKHLLDPVTGFAPDPRVTGFTPLYIGLPMAEKMRPIPSPLPPAVERAMRAPIFVPMNQPAPHMDPFKPHPSVAGTYPTPDLNWHPSKSQFPTIGAFHPKLP